MGMKPPAQIPCPVVVAEGVTGEQKLWRAVLDRQWVDAFSYNKNPEGERLRRFARSYLGGNGSDLREVCALAGVEVEFLRRRLHKAEADYEGWPRRRRQLMAKYARKEYRKTINAS